MINSENLTKYRGLDVLLPKIGQKKDIMVNLSIIMKNIMIKLTVSLFFSIASISLIINAQENSIDTTIIEKEDNIEYIDLGDGFNKLVVYLNDIASNIIKDHHFFSYVQPNTISERLLLFSIWIGAVENNPYNGKFGAYHVASYRDKNSLYYLSTIGDFIQAEFIR